MIKNSFTITVVLIALFSFEALQSQDKSKKQEKEQVADNNIVNEASTKIVKKSKADRYFENGEYTRALAAYKKIAKKTNAEERVYRNMATIYFNTSNFKAAAASYKVLFTKFRQGLTEEDYFRMLHINKALNKYKEANDVMTEYFKISDETKPELLAFQKDVKRLEDVRALGDRYVIKNLRTINTPASEFGAVRYGDQLMFSGSAREKSRNKFGWNGENYLDIYFTTIGKSKKGTEEVSKDVKPVPGDVNTKLHDATFTITRDGKTMYFTSNIYSREKAPRKEKNELKMLQLYKTEYIDGKWQKTRPLPINSNRYSIEHPALSPDEKTLYFASDMPGGYGGFDIYSVSISEGDKYGTPQNLGNRVNSKYREQFPYVTRENQLYFASDRISGFGSLDLYVSLIGANTIDKCENIGLPVNSAYDDFAFYIDTSNNRGYFSSNRPKGLGSDDIYELTETKPLRVKNCLQSITGVVQDSVTKAIIADAKIVLKNASGTSIDSLVTKSDENFVFAVVECQGEYILEITKAGYLDAKKLMATDFQRDKVNNDTIKMVSKGDANLKVEEELKSVETSKENEAKENIKNVEETFVKKERAMAADESIVKKRDLMMIKVNNIYFDFNLWYLRRESREELDFLLEVMKKYPEVEVEIGVHSDNRGNEDYNMALSQKRASVVKEYLTSKGLAEDRLSARGYGETMPVVDCINRNCTEEEYEQNRRSEFVITYY